MPPKRKSTEADKETSLSDSKFTKKAKSNSTVLDKIISAIRALKISKGSSISAITKYLLTEYQYTNISAIKNAIKKGHDLGLLTKNKASYLVTEDPIYEDQTETVDIQEIITGEGAKLVNNNTCTISYKGTLYDSGVQFDASKHFIFTLGAGEVIKGMEAIVGMQVGGRRKLVIPASLGYGRRGSAPDIPPGAILCFDITLLTIS